MELEVGKLYRRRNIGANWSTYYMWTKNDETQVHSEDNLLYLGIEKARDGSDVSVHVHHMLVPSGVIVVFSIDSLMGLYPEKYFERVL